MSGATSMRLSGIEGRTAFVVDTGRGIGHGVAFDVASEQPVERASSAVEAKLGAVEIVVLDAGVFEIESVVDTTFHSWRRTVSVNLDGVFLCSDHVSYVTGEVLDVNGGFLID